MTEVPPYVLQVESRVFTRYATFDHLYVRIHDLPKSLSTSRSARQRAGAVKRGAGILAGPPGAV